MIIKKVFPLYKDDGEISIKLPRNYRENVKMLKEAIKDGRLKLIKNNCLCHNEHPENDIIVSDMAKKELQNMYNLTEETLIKTINIVKTRSLDEIMGIFLV